jgi:hypothetical protein
MLGVFLFTTTTTAILRTVHSCPKQKLDQPPASSADVKSAQSFILKFCIQFNDVMLGIGITSPFTVHVTFQTLLMPYVSKAVLLHAVESLCEEV